jgi:hypothetical protein
MSGERDSAKVAPGGDQLRRIVTALDILDDNTIQRFTPSSAADASAPNIKFAYDDNYFYVQLTEAVWRRTAHSTW